VRLGAEHPNKSCQSDHPQREAGSPIAIHPEDKIRPTFRELCYMYLIEALLPSMCLLEALLLIAVPLDADGLAGHGNRDHRAKQRPPHIHHHLGSETPRAAHVACGEIRVARIRFDPNPKRGLKRGNPTKSSNSKMGSK
jgi:hypothetical protein